MRANRRRFQIETLEARDVPAMIVPILSPNAVIATPDHWHAAAAVTPMQMKVTFEDVLISRAAHPNGEARADMIFQGTDAVLSASVAHGSGGAGKVSMNDISFALQALKTPFQVGGSQGDV